MARLHAADVGPTAPSHAPVRAWLLTVALLVFLMLSLGGATRLTGSGLSITEWQPIVGTLPPLSEADWQEAFAKYREIPQYQQVNRGMSLQAFKGFSGGNGRIACSAVCLGWRSSLRSSISSPPAGSGAACW